ncbi:MAG: ribosome-associated translation inhibitor RaiA [Oscillospiraceae bacterium]|jgi:putative sigma-54 modulation protein|nr:MAG: ribosome-associated translation inhibitor RaiA [Oscillospiraceae bacterium]
MRGSGLRSYSKLISIIPNNKKESVTMKIVTNGRQMVVGTELKELFEKKLKRLDKYFDDDVTAYITLARKKNLERLELTISSKGTMFRSEVTADTFQTALDEAIEKITRQIVRNKTKLKKIVYSGEPDVSEPAEDEEEYNIKIVKTFDMHPMTSDEAILRMNLLDHSFFMYLNAETGKYNVVYLRNDGDYGIIEPM